MNNEASAIPYTQWNITIATITVTTTEEVQQKNIEMSKRQLELSKYVYLNDAHKDTHTHMYTQRRISKWRRSSEWTKNRDWIETETVQFYLSRVFFSWYRFVAWWTHSVRQIDDCVFFFLVTIKKEKTSRFSWKQHHQSENVRECRCARAFISPLIFHFQMTKL